IQPTPEVIGVFSVAGFSFGGGAPNRALIFVTLKPFNERLGDEHSAAAIINKLRRPLLGISGATVVPFPPPAVQGLGTFGGFELLVQDLTGGPIKALASATQKLIQAGNSTPNLRGLFTQFSANDPQYVVSFDREKEKALQVPLNQI